MTARSSPMRNITLTAALHIRPDAARRKLASSVIATQAKSGTKRRGFIITVRATTRHGSVVGRVVTRRGLWRDLIYNVTDETTHVFTQTQPANIQQRNKNGTPPTRPC